MWSSVKRLDLRVKIVPRKTLNVDTLHQERLLLCVFPRRTHRILWLQSTVTERLLRSA